MVRDLTEGTGQAVAQEPPRSLAQRVLGILSWLLPDFWDLHVYGGGALIAYGLWTWWPPAGPIAGGVLLVYLGLAWSPPHSPPEEGD